MIQLSDRLLLPVKVANRAIPRMKTEMVRIPWAILIQLMIRTWRWTEMLPGTGKVILRLAVVKWVEWEE